MPVAELISNYGKPHSVSANSGLDHYIWRLSSARLVKKRKRPQHSSSGAASGGSGFDSKIIRVYCELNVTTNTRQQVQSWNATGEGCGQILPNHL